MIMIKNSKYIFAVYVGLVKTGYNLSDQISAEFIENEIKTFHLTEIEQNYFIEAKGDTCEVNPYWPFGFIITYLALYLEELNQNYLTPQEVRDLLISLDQIDKRLITKKVIEWCCNLPSALHQIVNRESFNDLWIDYCTLSSQLRVVNSNISIDSIKGKLKLKKEIVVVLNELQAVELTDNIKINNKVFIISSRFNEDDVIHECLHDSFEEALKETNNDVDKYQYLLSYVLKDMVRYQYAWSDDLSSWRRVFEENIMRAATILLSNKSNQEKMLELSYFIKEGFIYTEPIYETMKSIEIDKISDKSSIINYLQSCEDLVKLMEYKQE